jgi:FkbM family methyltransferase
MGLLRRIAKRLRPQNEARRSFGLMELDLKVKPYIDFRKGFFIEAGANNGVEQSNTMYFEKYLGWKGLLIEPIPELAERCRANRPSSIVVNAALVPFFYKELHVKMRYCNLMSVVKGGMKSLEEEDNHVQIGCEVQHINTYEVEVPARTLTAILDEYRIRNVDFFSLDVEGYELRALQGLDLDRYHPTYMLIEARYREEIDAHLKPWYEPIAELSHHDVLYRYTRK